jgi:hypothetical protein
MPNFGSVQLAMITNVETTIAHAPIAHHQRGHANIDPAAARNSNAAISHSVPKRGEIGCVSCGRSASPNALAKPSTWIRPCTTSTKAKMAVISRMHGAQLHS